MPEISDYNFGFVVFGASCTTSADCRVAVPYYDCVEKTCRCSTGYRVVGGKCVAFGKFITKLSVLRTLFYWHLTLFFAKLKLTRRSFDQPEVNIKLCHLNKHCCLTYFSYLKLF